jgi:phospholipid/cholesterol/gamma-HCH transport system permease protein
MNSRNSRSTIKPYSLERFVFSFLLLGQVWLRFLQCRTYWRRVPEHLFKTGPASLLPVLLINGMGGMIFTIQTARELLKFGAINSLGGAFGVSFCRELSPILSATIFAGQVGSAFAAEIGAMKVTEQIDALYTLKTDPIDYLVLPRMVACCLMMPVLVIFALACGILGGIFSASQFYQIPPAEFIESIRGFLTYSDLIGLLLKGLAFGTVVGIISCAWGLTTCGGVKQIGESATAATVVCSIAIFVSDLLISLLVFNSLPIPH